MTACSSVKTNTKVLNQKEVMKIGDTTLTKDDVINSFYTYYQNNSNYFSYYDEETIESSFYTWSVMKQIISDKAYAALYNPETNKDGYIVYTAEDEKEVWESVYDYIYEQVSAYEEAIYEVEGVEKENYPLWLQEEEEEKAATEFETYKSPIPEIEEINKSEHKDKVTEEFIKNNKVEDLKNHLFKYVSSQNDEGEDVYENIADTKFLNQRKQAFANYKEGLASNAKANGTTTDADVIFLNEVVRVYEAYYDSMVTTKFQNYYLENYLLDTENGDKVSLGEKAVVRAYLEQYYSDIQAYQVEDGYIATMTSSEEASLVLYNYKGRNYFFTVQHILVKYDDYMTDEITKIDGYSSNSKYEEPIYSKYATERDALTNGYAMMTSINEDAVEQFKKSITVAGKYYYFDKQYKGDNAHNFGYIELTKTGEGDEITYKRNDTNEVVAEEDVLFMATDEEVISCYNTNKTTWLTRVSEYLADADGRAEMIEKYPDMKYVFETALNMKTSMTKEGMTAAELNEITEKINKKVASMLFVELQWIYSSDSLGNEFSNKRGYVVSNYPDEIGSWVAEFAVGARKVLAAIGSDNTIVNDATSKIISNYGYHIIKIEDIFACGASLVDMDSLKNDVDIEDADFVAEMADLLRQTYVASASNQTVYEYFFDKIYTELVGTSEASGTYFLKLEYEWLAEYEANNKIEYINKLTYNELMDSIA